MGDLLANDDCDVTQHRLLTLHALTLGQGQAQHRIEVELTQHRGRGQLIALAPLGMQLADDTDLLVIQQHACAAARMQGRMLCGHELQLARRKQCFEVALHIEEVNQAITLRPLRLVCGAPGQRGHAHRLAHAGDAAVALDDGGVTQEHTADLEHAHARRLAGQVVAQHLHQAADQAGAHHGQRRGNRVQKLDRVGIARQLLLPTRFYEAEVDGLEIVATGKRVAQRMHRGTRLRAHLAHHRRERRRVGQVRIAQHAYHFLDQVFLDLDVETPARGRHRQRALAFHVVEAEALEHGRALRLGQRHADDLGGTGYAQRDRLAGRQLRGLVVHGASLTTADVDDQLRDALDVFDRLRRIDTTLEAVTRIRREVELARAAGDRLGPPESGLDVDVPRVVRHGRGVAAHDAGKRLHLLRIGDDAHRLVELDRVAVQELQRLALLGPAHGQAIVDLVEVEDVAGATELEHHIVRDVDQRRHRALAATGQALNHPGRRLRLGIDAAHDAAGEAAAKISRFNAHRQLRVMLDGNRREFRLQERRASQRRDFPGDAVDAQAMRQIGGELQREERVVELQVLSDVLADGRIGGQLQQATVVLGKLQLTGRAQHAEALHTAQLSLADLERLAVFARG